MAETVELATIWLVDLVGSTRLATAVGPVRADSLRDEYFALLHDAIDASGGRAFKNTGDGLFVAFSSASAAVSCAVLTQQLFERRYRSAEQALHVRIGLGTGESTVRDGDYFGMPSIEAARLCDKAPADGILVSPATQMLAGRLEGARFESVGAIELKGIPEPMEAFAVVWEPLADESGVQVGPWPVPAALRSVPRAPYVGRADERALMERARAQARAGARQVVLLAGEPGIGKTRLASHAALRAHAEGFVVCWGACSEDVAAPYEPWIEVCSQLVEHAPEDVLAGYVAATGGEIARLARNLARRAPDAPLPQSSDPETERFLLFRALDELVLAVGRSQPLCVVLDDFHWADGQSVALLRHMARAVEQGALLVIVTYRDSDLTKDHPLTGALADLRRSDGVERVRLSGLGADEVAELMAAAAGHELDADGLALAGGLATETGGNPFFVGEILRNLIESGAITFDETARRWSVDPVAMSSLPESVREVVEHRIDRLGEDGREALTLAAVIGRSFDVGLLAQLVEMSETRLLDQLEAAVQASLLRESTEVIGRFDFEHALINHTLYQGLGGTRRGRLHHRVAEAIERLHGTDSDEHLGELALHWRLATVSVDKARAAGYSLRAGRRALDSLAPSEAANLFGDALDMLGAVPTAARCEALIGLGEAQRQTGVAAYRETLLEAAGIAAELGDADLAARAALANNRGFVSRMGGVDAERVGAIERALELDDPPQSARHARLLSLLAKELAFEPDRTRRRALGDEAIALAREASDPRTLATALESSCYSIWAPDTLATRSERVRELSALVGQVGDLQVEFVSRIRELNLAIELGDFGWADAALERAQAIAEQTRQPTQLWNASFIAASVACVRGELEASERLAERALRLGQEAGQPDAAMFYGGAIVQIRMLQGRGAEVIALIEGMVTENPGVPAWEASLGYTYCLIGRRTEGAEILARAAAQHFEHLNWDQNRLLGLAMYADTAAQTRSVQAAAMLYELIEPHADQFIWTGGPSLGHARAYSAMLAATLGRHEHADADFAFACDFHHRHGVHTWEARSELGWAEALAERGELDRAREHASRALELSRGHGYGAFEPRAAAIVASHAAIHP
jgi:class 3 adenylate cyclase/tetratricopeptide (TPR) repeat protein